MYCYNCGKEIAETVKFCPYCGAEQKQPQQSPQWQQPQQPIQQQPAQWQNPQQQDTQWQALSSPPSGRTLRRRITVEKQFLAVQTSHHSGSRRPCGRSSACSARVP